MARLFVRLGDEDEATASREARAELDRRGLSPETLARLPTR
jgi:hypothetical protein